MPLPTSTQLSSSEDNNLLETVRALMKRVSQLERRAGAKTNFVNASSVNVVVGLGNPSDINDPFTGTAILYPAYAHTSGNYHIFGMNAGVLQWGANSDNGTLIAGGGDVIIDEFGVRFKNQQGDLTFEDTNNDFNTLVVYSDGGNNIVLSNSFGGTGIRFDIDDISHNVTQISFNSSGIFIDGTAVLTATTRPIILHATHASLATVPASTTYYAMGFIDGLSATQKAMPVLRPGTVKNMYIRQVGVQPASGNMVITLQKNFVNTTVTATIPLSSGANQTWTDTAHSFTVVAGDTVNFALVNNATGASCTLGFMAFEIECDP